MADGNISTTTAATGISASTTTAANANDRRLIIQRVRRSNKVPGFVERHHNPACEIRSADHSGDQIQHIIRHRVAPQAVEGLGGGGDGHIVHPRRKGRIAVNLGGVRDGSPHLLQNGLQRVLSAVRHPGGLFR